MPIPGRRAHLCSSTELTLGGSKAAKIGSAASCSAAALAPQRRAQLAGGSNWDSNRPGGARGGRAAPRLEPRARCRGAHETGSPELWGSIATS